MRLFSDGPKGVPPHLAQAIEAARERLEQNPADAAAGLKLADALVASGQKMAAVRLLNRLGPLVQRKGRFVEAIAVYKKAAQIDPESELTSSTFLSLVQLRKLLEAAGELQPAQGAAPAAPAAPPVAAPLPPPTPAAGLPAPGAAGPSAWQQKREVVHEARSGIPLLRDVDPFLVELVLDKIRLRTLEPGEVLFREGSEGSTVAFVVAGRLAVTGRGDRGTEVLLREAGPGDSIGEVSFLTGLPRAATITATERVDLLELERNALAPIARKHRPLADALARLYEERVLLGVLARSRLFGVLDDPERRALARRLETVTVKAGTALVRQGEMDRSVYIVKLGAFRVTLRSGGQETAVALLRPHDVFGDLANVPVQKRTATVTAVTESELLRLPSAELVALAERHPSVRSALDEIQLERFLANAERLAGLR